VGRLLGVSLIHFEVHGGIEEEFEIAVDDVVTCAGEMDDEEASLRLVKRGRRVRESCPHFFTQPPSTPANFECTVIHHSFLCGLHCMT